MAWGDENGLLCACSQYTHPHRALPPCMTDAGQVGKRKRSLNALPAKGLHGGFIFRCLVRCVTIEFTGALEVFRYADLDNPITILARYVPRGTLVRWMTHRRIAAEKRI